MAFGTLKADTLTHSTAGSLATNFVVNGSAKAFHAKGNQSTGDFNSGAHTFNISNYVDHATGISRLNLTNAMTDSEYCVIGSSHSYDYQHFPVSSSQYSCGNVNSSGNLNDGITHGAVHGDLA